MHHQTFELLIEEENNASIPLLLSNLTTQSQQDIKHAMSCGALWVERGGKQSRVRRGAAETKAGDKLIYHYHPELLQETPPKLTAVNLKEDFSIWIKPRGMTISGSRYCDHASLKRCVETQHPKSPTVFVVHRLDRFTAGLTVVAHNKAAARLLSEKFRNHEIHKAYHAWVSGCFETAQTIEQPLDDKPAKSEVFSVKTNAEHSLVRVIIKTGRKHQVRRHLASINYPIIGDRQYGKSNQLDLQLAATSIGFDWQGEPLTYEVAWQELLADI